MKHLDSLKTSIGTGFAAACLLATGLAGCATDPAADEAACIGDKCDDLSEVSLLGIDLDVANPYPALRFDDDLRLALERTVLRAVVDRQLGEPIPSGSFPPPGLTLMPYVQFINTSFSGGSGYMLMVDSQDFLHVGHSSNAFEGFDTAETVPILEAQGDGLVPRQLPALRDYSNNMLAFRAALRDNLSSRIKAGLPADATISKDLLPAERLFVTTVDLQPMTDHTLFVAPRDAGGTRMLVRQRDFSGGDRTETWFEL